MSAVHGSACGRMRLLGLMGPLAVFFALFCLYGLLTDALEWLNPFLFPGWRRIFAALAESMPQLLAGLLHSLGRLAPSVAAAIVCGVAAGVFIGLHPWFERALLPLFHALNPIPSTMLIPYVIAVLPTFWLSAAALIFMGVIWPVLMNTLHGVAMLDPRWIDNARCLGMKKWRLVRRVVLPGAMPQIFAGIHMGLVRSFLLLTVAEMFGARAGLGYFVQYYADFARYDRVLAGMLWLSAVVVGLMALFECAKRRALFWTRKR